MLLSLLFIALLGASYTTQPNIAKLGNPTPNVFKDKKQLVWDENVNINQFWQNDTENLTYFISETTPQTNQKIFITASRQINTYTNNYCTIENVIITKYQWVYYDNATTETKILLGGIDNYIISKYNTFSEYAYFKSQDTFTNYNKIAQTIFDDNNYQYYFTYRYPYQYNEVFLASGSSKNELAYQRAKTTTLNGQWINNLEYQAETQDPTDIGWENTLNINYSLEYDVNTFTLNETIPTLVNQQAPLYTCAYLSFDTQNDASASTLNGQSIYTSQETYDAWKDSFWVNEEGILTYKNTVKAKTYTTQQTQFAIHYDNPNAQSGEVIDIGGLMWDIIGMPFTFINQAFNVTLFPGTIYQLNIGTLVKGLIAILTLLFIIKVFTNGLNVIGNYTGNVEKASQNKEDRKWVREERQMKREKHQKEMKE